jgi:hypothetical protein
MKYTPMTIPRPAQLLLSETNALVARITEMDGGRTNTISLKIIPKSAKMSKKHTEDPTHEKSRANRD